MCSMRAVIADDEANLLRYLLEALQRLWPELEVIATAGNGAEALALIRDEEPDVAFLDIRMPVLDGLQVARRIDGECHIVFITAYDEYAVQAFESAAVDYLLKPVEEQRLEKTIERLKALHARQTVPDDISQLISQLSQHGNGAKHQYLSWVRPGEGEQTHMIPVDEVVYFKADNKYTSVVTREKEYLIRKPISELAVELDPENFWQIHRGIVVQVNQIDTVKKAVNGSYRLQLKNHSDELTVSRRYAHLFKQM